MGTKYSTVAVAGFNASPPSDDGTISAANSVSWVKHITKIGTPLNNAVASINSGLLTALDKSARVVTANDSTLASDHDRTIEIGSTVTSTITISLADAATMTANYIVTVSNQSAVSCTIGRVTSGDTINGTAANVTILALESITFLVKTALNGYLIVKRAFAPSAAPTIRVFPSSDTYTRPTGLRAALIYTKAGGGSGGSSTAADARGGGGGEGEEAWLLATAATIGASRVVTIGAGGTSVAANSDAAGVKGGTTSFGVLLTAIGGDGGTKGHNGGAGGLGGAAGAGADYALAGAIGQSGSDAGATLILAAAGGGKGAGLFGTSAAANSGGGGGGGDAGGTASGAGAKGICVVMEYY